ncbi:geranylgeranyl diphosphate synthase, type I [Amycolatopsis lurida]|uniref:Dimethylallyltranstransferase n=1 Tax=Amycolatopsis lurida NRRL 2430 TaxID=1460371 RepID=A0A2P2FYT2_AMYLU|nr:polyprenyl synthetase family protein [Amycolatopsis lurida]KFU81877.1 dimethylallyltranstransferase [Amycolatopsis lurida NRRL 2430]SEB32314.1 geranylgeranyl diphosphate synthase, type I [Amycolatopsis lurida]
MTATGIARRGGEANESLPDVKSVIGPALREVVDRLPEEVRRVVGYHLGWLTATGLPAAGGEGKMIRPALAMYSALACGAAVDDAVPAAVAVQLVHEFSLLHDDVMDGDRTRRHRPSAWAVFGVPAAVLAGDALLVEASLVLADSGRPGAAQGVVMLSSAVRRLVAGQCADMDFETRDDVALSECVAMARGKTAALLGCCCALGALFGDGTPRQVECLRRFGEGVGLAFQLVDDILGIWGDPAKTGKPAKSDLDNRKKSLPVVFSLASGTAAGEQLADLYALDRPLSSAELVHAAELVETAGGRQWAQSQADAALAGALADLQSVTPALTTVKDLVTLAQLVAHRDH